MQADEEEAQVQQAQKDLAAFKALYDAYLPRVFAYVAYRVGVRQDAEDLTATVFLKVVQDLDRFEWRGPGSFAAWVFRIAHDVVADYHRRRARATGPLALEDLPQLQAHELLPLDQTLQKERFAHLYRLVACLAPRRQEVVTLKFFGRLRNKEIAAVLGLDERTVASHLCRGLEDLHRLYISESKEG